MHENNIHTDGNDKVTCVPIHEVRILEQRLQQSSDTITNLNSMIGGFSTGFTVIGVLITIFTIAIPIATYIFSIKPSQDAIKDLNNNIDKRLDDYFAQSQSSQIDRHIDSLRNPHSVLASTSIEYFKNNPWISLSENQLLQLIDIYGSLPDDNNVGAMVKSTIVRILHVQKSKTTIMFFKNLLLNTDDKIERDYSVINLVSTNDYKDEGFYKSVLKKFHAEDKAMFLQFVSEARVHNVSMLPFLLDSHPIIDELHTHLNPSLIQELRKNVEDDLAYLDTDISAYKSMYFFTK